MEGFLVAATFWQSYLQNVTQLRQVRREPVVQQSPIEIKNPEYFPPAYQRRKEKAKEFFSRIARPSKLVQKISLKEDVPVSIQVEKPNGSTIIFSPHPDDEVLCCSDVIRRIVSDKGDVKIIFLTDGDGLQNSTYDQAQAYGRVRKRESSVAARFLGLEVSDLFFLNFPDRHLSDLGNQQLLRSQYTGQNHTNWDSYFASMPYSRDVLKKNLTTLLKQIAPVQVYIPSETKDTHPDHQATSRLVREILSENGLSPAVFEYTVHGQVVDEAEKIAVNSKKLRLIQFFRSQFHDKFHKNVMEQFAYIKEVFDEVSDKIAEK
ncbi:PIG-L family deacetylase [Candidatus Gracilibacteria bacterium]|nr:PIG-L family deacetylase [Candidatus Gracilibacteria bacterium]